MFKGTTRQAQWQLSQRLIFTAGLVVVVCLAMAFAVLQCARKALLPRLLGSVGERALSNSDSEEELMDSCVEDGGESEEEATDVGPMQDKDLSEETGESKALEILEELRGLTTLGLRTVPYVPSNKQAFLLVLLLTICTQELILYGVYSTPEVEVQRQRTMDFVLEQGQDALAHLSTDVINSNAATQAGEMLELLQHFRIPRPGPRPEELFEEASISAYRISECKKALQQLQSWVEKSIPIPGEISRRALRLVTYTRVTGKARLRADAAAHSWLMEIQAQLGLFGIVEKGYKEHLFSYRMSLEQQIKRMKPCYTKLARALAYRVKSALSRQPLEKRLQEPPQQREQQQRQHLQPLTEHPHHPTSQLSKNIAAPISVVEPAEQPVTVESGVEVQPFPSFRHMTAASKGRLPTRNPNLLNPPLLQPARLPFRDTRRHTPTAHSEWRGRPPPPLVPGRRRTQHETKGQQRSAADYSATKPAFRANAPAFTPREPPHTDAHKRMPPIPSGRRNSWRPVPPSRGSEPRWGLPDRTKADRGWPTPHTPHFASPRRTAPPLSRPPSMPPQRQNEDFESALARQTPAPDSRTALQQHPRFLHPLSGPCAGPRSRRPAEGPSLRLPRSSLPSPTSGIPEHVPTPLHQFSGCQQQRATSRREVLAAFGPPTDGGAIGGTYSEGWAETKRLNPILDLIAEAFPEAIPEHVPTPLHQFSGCQQQRATSVTG
ncbi:hypothetical protein EBH_0035450, partial [Eimeria brunetti]